MKANSFLSKITILSIFVLMFTVSACKKETSNPNPTPPSTSNWDMEANLIYEDGSVVDFKCNFDTSNPFVYPQVSHEDSASYFFLPGNYGQINLIIQGNINGPGNYSYTDWPEDGDIGVNINVMGVGSSGESEFYANYESYSGAATFKVISFANNHIKGTFSGKLFQDAGSKVIIIENGRVETDLVE
ncbi:hypothetical protein ERX46_02165 [Brumimicrobium glaciale]|uniref:Uncharacterized protein n=1 Tax=Brumimicrobium glaciale TaxID=200475 RepID=A0A4V1WG85_9FLAO|nr:hypothetical protein [Brumimicrobium glaciale]RYM35821.1 hypothetical protein ERX46_02165 [Brumimicrobium glaciale]